MGDVAPEKPEVQGVIERAGETIRIVEQRVVRTAYGAQGGAFWPLLLLCVAAIALAISSDVGDALGFISLVLLALWIGSSRRM